jgi:hypothetical protein
MLAELRRHVSSGTTTRQAAFEDLTAPPSYDLVYVGAGLHWTSDEDRWPRIARLLEPQGGVRLYRRSGPPRPTRPRGGRPCRESPVARRRRHTVARRHTGVGHPAVAGHGAGALRLVHRRTPGRDPPGRVDAERPL